MRSLVVGVVLGAALAALVRPLRRPLRHRSPLVVGLVVAGFAVAGALVTDGRPTGTAGVDPVLRALLVGAVSLAGSRSRRTPLLLVAAVAALVSPEGVARVAAFAALGAVFGSAWGNVRSRPLGAAVAGTAALVLLSAEWPEPHGSSAAVAGACFLVLGVSAMRRLRKRQRRPLYLGIAAVSLVVLVVVGVYGMVALRQRERVQRAVDLAETALTAARSGDSAAAAAGFEEAASEFAAAGERLDAWWTAPVAAVPVLAQNAETLDLLVASGTALADAGRRTASELDPAALSPVGGKVDLEVLRGFREPLATLQRQLAEVEVALAGGRSPWVVAPLDDAADEVVARSASVQGDVQALAAAADVLPGLLGGDGTRRYFLVVQSTAESRGSGGLMGNWGVVEATDGQLTLPQLGRYAQLAALGEPSAEDQPFEGIPPYEGRWTELARVNRFWQNITSSPDFPTAAAATERIAARSVGEVDGVIAIDPTGLAALLRLTGPVTIPEYPEPITADNVERILLHEQYLDPKAPGRIDFLESTARAVFDRLTTSALPSPPALARALGPAVAGRHLQLASSVPEEQAYLLDLGAAGDMPPLIHDAIGLVVQDATESKLQWFLHRAMRYDVDYDRATGEVTGSVEVTLRNDATESLPGTYFGRGKIPGAPNGTNRVLMSLYGPTPLQDLTVDGQPATWYPGEELEWLVSDAFLTLLPGQQVTARYEVRGQLQPGPYRLDVLHQPAIRPDDLVVEVNGRTLFDGPLDRDITLTAGA